MSISVCMAMHNGAAFLREQIDSILPQLGPADELIAIDDASSDDTVAILEGFHDARVQVIGHERNQGVVKTFERALCAARGELIFLCDQDDVWRADKAITIVDAFRKHPEATLVMSNANLIDAHGRSLGRALHATSHVPMGIAANLLRNRFQGATMAFRRELLEAVLPIPETVPMHDSWIGMINAYAGRGIYLPDELVYYRRHGNNVTSGNHQPVSRMLAQRYGLIKALAGRWRKVVHLRKTLRAQVARVRSGRDAARVEEL